MSELRKVQPKMTLLERTENEYERHLKKLDRLRKALKKASPEKKAEYELKIKDAENLTEGKRLIFLARKLEQAGRNLVKAATDIVNTPVELENIISLLNNVPRKQNLKDRFKSAELSNEINYMLLNYAFEGIRDAYKELFNIIDDDEDGENDEETEPLPDSPGGNKKPLPTAPDSGLIDGDNSKEPVVKETAGSNKSDGIERNKKWNETHFPDIEEMPIIEPGL